MENKLINNKHRKYRLIEKYDNYTIIQDVDNGLTHSYVKLENHEVGDEFCLYIKGRNHYKEDKLFFEYSILNNYVEGECYTFDIVEERDNYFLISNCPLLTLAVPSSFVEWNNQKKIELEVEELDLETNRVMFKRKPEEKFNTTDDLSLFVEGVDYKFDFKKTFTNKRGNQVLIVCYENNKYYINTPPFLSHAIFKSPVEANIATREDGSVYLRLSRKYISETLYTIGKKYTFKITSQVSNHESGINYWLVEDEYGYRSRYFPQNDLSFEVENAKLREGDTIDLTLLSISNNGNIKLVLDVDDLDKKNYLVEEVFDTIGFYDKEDEYFFEYANVLGIDDEVIDEFGYSFLEQYNEGNNLWLFSYLGFLDGEIFNELAKGDFDNAKTLIELYLRLEKWMLEDSDYLSNFSHQKIGGIIAMAEDKISKLKATNDAIDIFLKDEDEQYINELNASLLRTPYLRRERKEMFKQFLNISQYFRGEADLGDLSYTVMLLLERDLIEKEDRWSYINSINSFIYNIRKKINEWIGEEGKGEKPKELNLLITYHYLLVYLYLIDGKLFNASVTSINLLRNLSLYYNKIEYLDLAIKLITDNGYLKPSIIRHKDIFEISYNEIEEMCDYDNEKEFTYQGAGNILNLNGNFTIIPKNLYSKAKGCELKTLAQLSDLNLYVKSHYDLDTIDMSDTKDEIIKNAINAITISSKDNEYEHNYVSYKELDISYDEVYEGNVNNIHSSGDYCYVTCVIDDFEIQTLLHINTFNRNKLGGYMDEFMEVGDVVKFKVIGIDDDRIEISTAHFIDEYADIVLDEEREHYGKVVESDSYNSKVMTKDGLVVTTAGGAYELGDVVKLKIIDYREHKHLYISREHELYDATIADDRSKIFRSYLIATGMLIPKDASTSYIDDMAAIVTSTMHSAGHIDASNNSDELRRLSVILIHILEQRLRYITKPEEIALNYFFIITLSGVMQNPKSFEYSTKLDNLAKIVRFENAEHIELLHTELDKEFVDKNKYQLIDIENSTIEMLNYVDTEWIELPVNIDPTSPQYKLKKLIECSNLIKSYELGGKLTSHIKNLIVHELYNALNVSDNSIKELQSILIDENEELEIEKSKRVVTNLGAESKYKEFKTSIFHSASDVPQKDVIMRTICGFLNAYDGVGSLFIGVKDSGEINGLKDDLNYIENVNNIDRYQNYLQQMVVDSFPKEINSLLDYEFHKSNNLNYLEIIIPCHDKPITYKNEFFQRQGVQTRILKGQDITDFIVRKTSGYVSALHTPVALKPLDVATYTVDEATEAIEVDDKEAVEHHVVSKQAVTSVILDEPRSSKSTEGDVDNYTVLAYLYILENNMYMLSATKIKQYVREIVITEKYRFGHLMFCYDNAFVNKVDVRSIINKSFNIINLNALSDQGNLMAIIKSHPGEKIGVETKRLDKSYVKLYDIDNIAEHKIMGLKGTCIAQDDFDSVVAYYHCEHLPQEVNVFEKDDRQGLGAEATEFVQEYKMLKNCMKTE